MKTNTVKDIELLRHLAEMAEQEVTKGFTEVRAAILRAISNIGERNGHKCPTDNETDSNLHNLLVAHEGKKYFERQYERIIKEIEASFDKEIKRVTPGSTGTVVGGDFYTLVLQVNQPASRVDTTKFVTELRRLGVMPEVIDAARASATIENRPARRYSVVG